MLINESERKVLASIAMRHKRTLALVNKCLAIFAFFFFEELNFASIIGLIFGMESLSGDYSLDTNLIHTSSFCRESVSPIDDISNLHGLF